MSAIYINTETMAYPVWQGAIRDANPWITPDIQGDAFPNPPPAPFALVMETPMPEHDNFTQRAVETTPELIDGVWYKTWEVVDRTPEETEFLQQLIAEQEAKRAEAEKAYADMQAAGGPAAPTFIEIP